MNKIKFGLRNAYYSKISFNNYGEHTYIESVAIPGAVNLSLSGNGNSTDFFKFQHHFIQIY